MIGIKEYIVYEFGNWFDFELENGILLHSTEWNGDGYIKLEDKEEIIYKPIYKKINNSKNRMIVGFERIKC